MLIFSLIFLQVVIFVGMILILKRIMTENVVSATKHIEELNEEYLKKEELATRQLEEAKQKSENIIMKATQEAEAIKNRILKEANTESKNILTEARTKSGEIIQQADRSREHLIMEIEEKIAASAVDKAIELIHDTVPEKFLKDIHSQWVGELIENGFGKVERLNIPKDISEIKLISAFELQDEQRKGLAKKLKSVLGYEAKISEETDPKIVAGLVLNVGSLILDGSLKNRIREGIKSAKYTGEK